MYGFFNRLLRVDLTRSSFAYEEIPDSLLRRSLGGKGLGAALLMKENPVGVDPLATAAVFILTVGPLTGTKVWGSSRFGAFAKSPATGGYGESYCGGSLAGQLKGCGIDAVILTGRCEDLSFLLIDEKGPTFLDASSLRGRDTVETEEHLLGKSHPGARALVIGPAGEQLSAIACIKSDRWRSLGRGGLGAVLGSKNIKGVSFAGNLHAVVADEALLMDVNKRVAAKGKITPATERYQRLGTPMQVAVTNNAKCFPTRYWKGGVFEKWDHLSADYMQEHFKVKACGCPLCFMHCTKNSVIQEGRHSGLEVEGPEYETIYALGGLNAIDSLEEVAWLNDVCDRLGIDTMSAGNLSSFAVEAYKAGKTDFPIDYNQPDRMAELFTMIATGQGLGKILGKGIKSASRQLGLSDIAIHVKGLEPAGFDPRTLKGMALSYATSARGACHLRGTFYKAELSGEVDGRPEGMALHHIDYEDRAALFDSMILCRFFRDLIMWEELADLIQASMGLSLTRTELQLQANWITELTRAYNHREGLGPETDTLPKRFLTEATVEGKSLDDKVLSGLIGDYNEIRTSRLAAYGQGLVV